MIKRIGMIFAILVALGNLAFGAEFSFEQDPVMGCYITLKGEIKKGDSAKFEAFSDEAVEKFRTSTPEGFSVGNNNAIKIKKRLCLESPGGSLSEAIGIAKVIYSGWGTAIGRGKACESACSIIFMAGSVSPEDDRGTIAQRILHPLGRLGFHAPSLKIAQGEYSADTVSKAYDIALAGIGQIYEIAGFIKFPPSLIGEMIATPPGDMLYIETIGQASRWHISVAPGVGVEQFGELAIINACNNHYLFKSEVISLNGQYDRNHKIYYDYANPEIKHDNDQISATMDGFGQEAASVCDVSVLKSALKPNALPTDYLGWVGIEDSSVEIYPSQFFGPSTPLASLARANDELVENIRVISRSKDIRKSTGRCFVFQNTEIVDSDPCNEVKEMRFAKPVYVVSYFVWPSGAKTVVESEGQDFGDRKINGIATQEIFIQANDQEHQYYPAFQSIARIEKLPGWEASCWNNTDTGKTFCFQRYYQSDFKFQP